MEIILVLIALGVGVYFFLRSNTRRGAETVRAYVYLGGIRAGKSPEEANQVVNFDMVDAPTDIIRGAMAAVKRDYGGKQLALIGEAYRLGMQSKRSTAFTETVAANTVASREMSPPGWVMPFVLYYVAWEMRAAGTGIMPASVRALASGKLDAHQQQDLLASLQNYLSFSHGKNREAGDAELVIREARDFLQAELRTLNSTIALKLFIRRSHKQQTGTDITDAELLSQFTEISNSVKVDEEAGYKLRNMLLSDSVATMFTHRHKKQIDTFVADLSAHFQAAN